MVKSLSLSLVPKPSTDSGLEIILLPIFPLPTVVFFPNTLLPLHIFEPRYRQMVEDSLRGERQIGMVLAKQGTGLGGEAWHSVGGMGEITELQRLEDGKFDILLAGRSRFRIIEIVQEAPYCQARVQLLSESLPDDPRQGELTNQLIEAYQSLIQEQPKSFDPKVLSELNFPTLINSICASIPIGDSSKQQLLEINDLEIRAEQILLLLERLQVHQNLVSQFEHLRPDDPTFN